MSRKWITALALLALLSTTAGAFAATDSATYTYDLLGRLTLITYADGATIAYNYDTAGNRTSVVVTANGSGQL